MGATLFWVTGVDNGSNMLYKVIHNQTQLQAKNPNQKAGSQISSGTYS
jgi:hypothetical protein